VSEDPTASDGPPATATDASRAVATTGAEAGTSAPTRPTRRRLAIYLTGTIIALLVLAALAVYVWKTIAVRGLEARFAAERIESSSAQRQALTTQARDLLRLTARPLAWSVRAEMLRGNLGQVDDYFRELVHERGVASLILVDKDGRIALATNRKLETQPATSVISKTLLEAPDVASEESGSSLRLAVPVMAFDRRIGTLVVDYDLQGR
jgi:hypothetical protein